MNKEERLKWLIWEILITVPLIWYTVSCYYWVIQWLVLEPFELSIQLNKWHMLGLLFLVKVLVGATHKDHLLGEYLKRVLSKSEVYSAKVKWLLTAYVRVTMLLGIAYLLKDMI
jgi:hypothetical protein